MNLTGVILAGGHSLRMGRDKAWLEVEGRPLLARQAETLRAAGADEILISGRPEADYAGFGWRVVADEFAGAGPLAGIHAALRAARAPLLLVLAVDMPAMRPEVLAKLAQAAPPGGGAVPRIAGWVEPLAAFYPRLAGAMLEALLRSGSRAAHGFAEACVAAGFAVFVDLPAADAPAFANWNSPADLPGPPPA